MFKRLFKINRYFLVKYSFKNGDGCIETFNTNGGFINKEWLQKEIEKTLKEMDVDYGNIIIDNIMEVSKSDFKDYNKKEENENGKN